MSYLPSSALRILALGLALGTAQTAQAYPTRIHIALANDIRTELLASPDGRTIRLAGTDHVVRLSEDDARAVRDWPLAFRAGAIGPDNFVFPAMTDLTHAIGLRPYDQCEDLYQLAETDEETAYAMGCFLHGSSDAVAHHYVNWLTGETFTLNPITEDRGSGFSNVVRHMVSESMIQEAWREEDPEAFEAPAMLHAIPEDFVLRTVMNPDSVVWGRMATHAMPQWETVQAADPDATVFEHVAALEVAPAEYLVLLPLILDEAHLDLDLVLVDMQARVAELQDHSSTDGSELLVTAGSDGVLGTSDDDTDCATTCPTLYMTYSTLVALLEPQTDSVGNPQPSAADVLLAELHSDLDKLLPAYVETIAQTSAMLNSPLEPGQAALDVQELDVRAVTGPLDDWASDLADIDWDLLARTVLPDWLVELEATLDGFGINLNLGSVLQGFIQPRIDDLVDAVTSVIMSELETMITQLATEFAASESSTEAEFHGRLVAASPTEVSGTILDHWSDSGVYMHSLNVVAATLADHRMVLPVDDAYGGVGPASFDASYTLAWSQPAACEHLAPHIFPAGLGLEGLLSIQDGDTVATAVIDEEAPVECHGGDLGAFADSPTQTQCVLTDLDALLADPVGSLSRAYPPEQVGGIDCLDIELDGLPPIPVDPDPDTDTDPIADTGGGSDGCGCATSPAPSSVWVLILALLAGCARRDAADSGTSDTDTGEVDTGEPIDTGEPGIWKDGPAWALVQSLGDSVWSGPQQATSDPRVRELHFDATHRLTAEVLNPWGPGRERVLRAFSPSADGASIHTIVQTPAGRPLHPDEGTEETWPVSVAESVPRQLHVTRAGGAQVYLEGETEAPSGLTAIARAFEPGETVDDAFCQSGTGGFTYSTLFDFARGGNNDELVAEEIVGGVPIQGWSPSSGNFALSDLAGFDRNGGTDVVAPTNWMVRYVGTIQHPGGSLAFRERNDSIEDGLWVWLGNGVGGNSNDWFLEVHGFFWADGTSDEPSGSFPAGELDIEVLMVRCDVDIESVDLEFSVNGGSWQSAALLSAQADVSEEWFPPAF